MSDLRALLAECHGSFMDSLEPLDVEKLVKHAGAIPTRVGAAFGGGTYIGRIALNGKMHAVVVAPQDGGETKMAWGPRGVSIPEAMSKTDGMSNTLAMAAGGSELAQWALALRIGGFSDWHIPAQEVLNICYLAKDACPDLGFDDPQDWWYWSSTQHSARFARGQRFLDGKVSNNNKWGKSKVRAVRLVPIDN